MNANIQPPAAAEKTYRYTGFNEPFSHVTNTTLAHPDADTSANATIEGLDFNLTRTHSRSSFFRGKSSLHASHSLRHPLHRNRNSVGAASIGSDLGGLYDNIQYADGSKETKSRKEIETETEERDNVVSAPRERSIIPGMLGGRKEKGKGRMPNDSGVDMGSELGRKSSESKSSEEFGVEKKRKGFMGKFGL